MTDAELLRGRAVRLLAVANRLRKRGNDQHRDLLVAKAKVLLDEADLDRDRHHFDDWIESGAIRIAVKRPTVLKYPACLGVSACSQC